MPGFGAGQQDVTLPKEAFASNDRDLVKDDGGKSPRIPKSPSRGQLQKSKRKSLEQKDIDRIHSELRRAMNRSKLLCEELLMKHDKDHSGTLSKEELKRVFRVSLRIPIQRLSDDEIEQMLDTLDVDGSGSLTIDEVAMFMDLGCGVFFDQDIDYENPMAQAAAARDRLQKRENPANTPKSGDDTSKSITTSQINESNALRKEAQKLFDFANGLKDKTVRKNMHIGYDVQSKLKSRIVNHEVLVTDLMECITRVEPSTYLMQMSIQELQKARTALWPPLSMVRKRIKIRKELNTAELERDYFQEALYYEEQLLEQGRQTLGDRIERGKEILQGLEDNREEMRRGVDASKGELKEDRTILLVAQDKLVASGTTCKPDDEAKVQAVARGRWKDIAGALVEATRGLEEDSKIFREQNCKVLSKLNEDVAKANQHSMDCLDAHMKDMAKLRKQIEKEIYHSHHAVSGVEQTITNTRRHIDKTHHPLQNTKKHYDQVNRCDKTRGTIVASVQSKHDKLSSTAEALSGQHEWASTLLDQLNESHQALIQDHQSKLRALKIDEHCLRVAPDKEEDHLVKKRLERHCAAGAETLLPSQLSELRMKIRAAASTGIAGRLEMDKLFKRLNPGGSGEMTDCQVKKALRFGLRIPKEVISDVQISALCAMLDKDCSGAVEVRELAEFIAQEQEQRSLKVRVRAPVQSAREKKEKAEIQERPPIEDLPVLKPSVLQQLRRKIKCAASSAQESLETLFARFDKDHSGELEDIEIKKALRYALKIPKSVITDLEIFSWCSMLDGDNSGSIDIAEIVSWINHSECTAFVRREPRAKAKAKAKQ